MENLFTPDMSLFHADKILQQFFSVQHTKHRLVSNLPLTESDFYFLANKMKELQRFKDDILLLEDVKLSMVVTWIFSIKLGKTSGGHLNVQHYFQDVPQHLSRHSLLLVSTVFDEYGLDKFGITPTSLKDIHTLIKLHATV